VTEQPREERPADDERFWGGRLAGPVTWLIVLAVYVVIGMYFHPLLSWTRGFIVAFVGVWLIPHLYRRWRRK